MAVPTSPGSRFSDRAPTLPQAIRALRRQVDRLANRNTAESVCFVPNDSSRWEPIASGSDVTPLFCRLYRRGAYLTVTVYTDIPAGTAITAHLWFEDQDVSGPPTVIDPAVVGTRAATALSLDFPSSWPVGQPGALWVRGHRTAGSGTARIAVLRVAQR